MRSDQDEKRSIHFHARHAAGSRHILFIQWRICACLKRKIQSCYRQPAQSFAVRKSEQLLYFTPETLDLGKH